MYKQKIYIFVILAFGDNNCNSNINSNIVKIVTLTTNDNPTTSPTTKYFKIETSTNELPLSEIDFSLNPLTPDIILFDNYAHTEDIHPPTTGFLIPEQHHKISPLATNERPLSCTCLATLIPEESSLFEEAGTYYGPTFPSSTPTATTNMSPKRGSSSANLEALSNLSASAPSLVVLTEISDAEVQDLRLTVPIKSYELSDIGYIKPLAILRRRSQSQENLLINAQIDNNINSSNTNISSGSRKGGNKVRKSSSAVHCTCVSADFDNNYINSSNSNSNNSSNFSSKASFSKQYSSKTNSTLAHNVNNNNNPKLKSFKIHTNNKKSSENATVTSAASSSSSTSSRRQRHSIAGQMSYMKMLGFGGFGKKTATSTNSLFSTAVISGSSSAPNLRDMIPSTATVSGEYSMAFLFILQWSGF